MSFGSKIVGRGPCSLISLTWPKSTVLAKCPIPASTTTFRHIHSPLHDAPSICDSSSSRSFSSLALSFSISPQHIDLPMQDLSKHDVPLKRDSPVIESPPEVASPPVQVVPQVQNVIDDKVFARMSPIERIQAIFEIHGEKAAQLASMQKTSGVVMHLIYSAGVPMPVLFFDTQYLFQETIDLKNEFAERYGLNILTITPQLTPEQQNRLYGTDLWKTRAGQVQCCYMRKEKPLIQTIENMGLQATLSGMMQKEGGARSSVKSMDVDPRTNTTVYNPLFDWTNKQVHEYTQKHNIPVHNLYSKKYLSIGCAPCTTPVKPGEHPRAGRWRHLRKNDSLNDGAYCGMNYTDIKEKNGQEEKARKKSYLGLKKR